MSLFFAAKPDLGVNPELPESENLASDHSCRPRAFQGHIDEMTLNNQSFRKVLYTSKYTQLVLMNLMPSEVIDREIHFTVDQFFRVESGSITIQVEDPDEMLQASDGWAIIIPAKTYHTVTAGPKGAKLYTLYSPPNHPYDRIQDEKPSSDDE
ncbi:MAG: cupin domain-containing protein [Candidatus Roizmanbacteria bacterium]